MTPEQIITGGHRVMSITEGVLLYKQKLVIGILQNEGLTPKWKQAYQMLETAIENFLVPVHQEQLNCELMWKRRITKTSDLKDSRIGEIVFPTPISFTAEISVAGKALNDFTLQDRSLEGLSDPARYAAIHNALSSDMTIASCGGFWYHDQMGEWWAGLQEYEKGPTSPLTSLTWQRKLWNTWRRAVEGGHRQVQIGRGCFPDSAGFYWRAQGKGIQTTTSRDESDFDIAYNYYQDQPSKPLVCYDGCYILDTSELSGGDAALEETSPYDIDDTDPS